MRHKHADMAYMLSQSTSNSLTRSKDTHVDTQAHPLSQYVTVQEIRIPDKYQPCTSALLCTWCRMS